MILDIIQVSKDLFSAEFKIFRNSEEIGSFSLEGKINSMEADVVGQINGESFKMHHGKLDDIEVRFPFRPYIINESNIDRGTVYQTKYNGGLFKKFDFHQMKRNGIIYDLFPIGFGNEGSKSPIYQESKQIAQIDKDCIVYNDLHKYRIYAEDEHASQIAIFFAIYMYVNAGFKPGEKVVSSTVKVVSITTNKALKEKYNPTFMEYIDE